MGSSIKAYYDDCDRYTYLCERYGEEPVRDEHGICPYGDHASELEARARNNELGPEERREANLLRDTKAVFETIGTRSYENAVAHGFWSEVDRPDRNDAEAIALMHSELSEMLESVRRGNPPSKKIPNFTETEEEGADLLIRFFDWAQGRDLRIAEALFAKMAYNAKRPHLHGKRF